MELNNEQITAIKTSYNNVLVVAGPGTGKTRVITERFKWLVNEEGISPHSIMVLTFSNKASYEIVDRLQKTNMKPEWVGTFHGICFKLLTFYGGYSNIKIIDEQDQLKIIEKLNLKTITPDKISLFKDGLIANIDLISEIRVYNSFLQDNNMMDFSDLINFTIDLLENNEEFRQKITTKFVHIMVDEYQDTSTKQDKLIKIMASSNLFCVGDDDQSIYGWRGANISNIIEFSRKNDVSLLYLGCNYRSNKTIVECANRVISFNRSRIQKAPWAFNQEERNINVCCSSNEYDFLSKKLKAIEGATVGILLRTGILVREFKAQLDQRGVPTILRGGLNFFQKKEIKLIVNYLRALYLEDYLSFEYIINSPKRGVGPKKMEQIHQWLNERKSLDEIVSLVCKDFHKKWTELKELLYEFCDEIIVKLKDIMFPADFFNADENASIELLIKKAKNQKNMGLFLQEIIMQNLEQETLLPQIMTVHAAKGLEFDYVFLPSMVEGIFPNFKAMIDNPEEERRLAYVALTRAKKQVFMSYNLQNSPQKMASSFGPSRFIHNIPHSSVKFILG